MFPSALLLTLAVTAAIPPAVAAAEHGAPAGAYEILICKGACSFSARANVVVHGVLVWMPTSLTPTEVGELREHDFRRVHYGDEAPNACFVLRTVVEARTFAGLDRTGIASWSRKKSQFKIGFYSSPDAEYIATVTYLGEQLEGKGESWGGAPDEPTLGQDTVIGRRVGAAFPMKCIEAAQTLE